MKKEPWYVYLALCCDNTLYCGIAKDVAKRIYEHNFTKKGSKYTRGRRHVMLTYKEECADQSAALVREAKVKKMTRAQKDALRSAYRR